MKAFTRKGRADRRNQPTRSGASADEIPPGDKSVQGLHTIWAVRGLLLVQVVGFVVLASIHVGLLIGGYRRPPAGATELVIAVVVVVALVLTWAPPAQGQRAVTAAQFFAMLGVLVGLVTVTLGVERGTNLEVAVNLALLLTATTGLVLTAAWRRERRSSSDAS
jgi:hypothetical protein